MARLLPAVLLAPVPAACGSGAVPGEETTTLPTGPQRVGCAGAGPAVVLVNGIGDDATSAQWTDVARELADHARVCRYDRPGTGGSPDPSAAGRGPDELVAELHAVVEHAAGQDEVVLVAHSFGGYLSRLYAREHPDRIAGLVFVDALDPSVGLLRGTGAASLDDVAMAGEGLDLAGVERAAASVSALPGDPPVIVLSRGRGSSPVWTAGQEQLAALSARSERSVVPGTGHQVPTDAPASVTSAVDRLLEGTG